MPTRVCSIGYLPAESDPRFQTKAFVANLAENKPAGDLLLYSDHPQPDAVAAGFNVIQLKKNVEIPSLLKARIRRPGSQETVENKAAINNLIFLTGLRIAEHQGYSHFIYLESDCRVKNFGGSGAQGDPATGFVSLHVSAPSLKHWDSILFDEFFRQPRHLLVAGSVMAYNVANHNRQALERYERFLVETKSTGRQLPVPPYGWLAAGSGQGCNIFANGAGAIYSIAAMKMLFPERDQKSDPDLAASIWAYDFAIGLRIWEKFQADCWELIGHLNSLCSQYGNVLSTEAERLQWLDEGRFCMVHQVKGGK